LAEQVRSATLGTPRQGSKQDSNPLKIYKSSEFAIRPFSNPNVLELTDYVYGKQQSSAELWEDLGRSGHTGDMCEIDILTKQDRVRSRMAPANYLSRFRGPARPFLDQGWRKLSASLDLAWPEAPEDGRTPPAFRSRLLPQT